MASDATGPAKQRRPRRDRRREHNRQKLLDAAIDEALEHGVGAVTMAGIAKRAEVHHPAFYAHFKNVDECLREAARFISERQRATSVRLRREVFSEITALPDPAAELRVIEAALQGILDHARYYGLLLRNQREEGPIGEVAREEAELTRKELTEHLWEIAIRVGIGAGHLREIEVMSRHLLNLFFGAAIDLMAGTATDLHAEAQRIDRYSRAIVSAEFRRMLKEQEDAGEGPPTRRRRGGGGGSA